MGTLVWETASYESDLCMVLQHIYPSTQISKQTNNHGPAPGAQGWIHPDPADLADHPKTFKQM